nr:hypothetical protein [Tanacetum cinerariifolium]
VHPTSHSLSKPSLSVRLLYSSLIQTRTPIPTPLITTKAPPVTIIPDPLPAVIQRVSVLKNDVQELKEVDNTITLSDLLRYEIPSAVNAYLRSSLGYALQKTLQHSKKTKRSKTKESKPSKKSSTSKESSKGKSPNKTSKSGKSATVEEPVKEPVFEMASDDIEQTVDDVANDVDQPPNESTQTKDKDPKKDWFKQPPSLLLLIKNGINDPFTFEELMATLSGFSKYAMNQLKIDNLTQAHLVGPVYEPFKGRCTSSIELEYNMEEFFKPMTEKLDWNNLEGDCCPYDLTKPLPLKGRPGHLTIVAEYFFNNDLEFLKSLDPEKRYTTSITKTKAARYEIMGIEDMVLTLWSATKVSVSVKKLHGYGYMEEIAMRRANHQVYKLKEGNLVVLHLNNIEDMILLAVQHKLFQLDNIDIVDLIVALQEPVKEPVFEMASDDIEQTVDDVANDVDQPPNESTQTKDKDPKKDWFKQPPSLLLMIKNGINDPFTFEELMATLSGFSKYAMNQLKIDNLTQAHLVGPVYEPFKGRCTSSIELEYNMEEFFKPMTEKLDWNNLEGDCCPYDLTKPLPLKGRPGHLTIVAEYFFNNDLEFLKSLDPEKRYTTSITKTKAARVSVKKLHGYGYMEEIAMRRANHQNTQFPLGYNKEMNRKKRSAIDRRRSKLMVKPIDKQMRERRIIMNPKRLVGARELEMDYKLMTCIE